LGLIVGLIALGWEKLPMWARPVAVAWMVVDVIIASLIAIVNMAPIALVKLGLDAANATTPLWAYFMVVLVFVVVWIFTFLVWTFIQSVATVVLSGFVFVILMTYAFFSRRTNTPTPPDPAKSND
jgi:hypothetical protein